MPDHGLPPTVIAPQAQVSITAALADFTRPGTEPLPPFIELLNQIGRNGAGGINGIGARHTFFLGVLERDPGYREAVGERVVELFSALNQVSFYTAFSAANLAYALVAMDFKVPAGVLLVSGAGVALISLVNLAVSFARALWTALKSRGIDRVPLLEILQSVWKKLLADPLSFFRIPAERVNSTHES